LHDALMIEERGTAATVIITEPFQTIVASHALKLGAPGYHSLVVPHPVYGRNPQELRLLAGSLVDRALVQLVGERPGGLSLGRNRRFLRRGAGRE
jgi:hypothetical protein